MASYVDKKSRNAERPHPSPFVEKPQRPTDKTMLLAYAGMTKLRSPPQAPHPSAAELPTCKNVENGENPRLQKQPNGSRQGLTFSTVADFLATSPKSNKPRPWLHFLRFKFLWQGERHHRVFFYFALPITTCRSPTPSPATPVASSTPHTPA